MLSATRGQRAVDTDRRAPNHSRPIAGAFIFFPSSNQRPQAMRIDIEGRAYFRERERPFQISMENPGPSFPEFLSPARTRCIEIALKTSHRIGQDPAHQAHYRFDCSRSTPRGIKLRGHKRISAKIVTCVTNCRVDSCSWLFHVATYLARGLPKTKSPHGRGCFWGRGTEAGPPAVWAIFLAAISGLKPFIAYA
jgi:hypothetical protein